METTEQEFSYSKRESKQQAFDKRLIKHIVSLIEQGIPRRDLMKEYGMSSSTLIDWVQKYGSSGRVQRSYTSAEKRSVVRAVESGMSVKQAQITFNISYPSVIRSWMKKFKEENTEISAFTPLDMSKKVPTQSENPEIQALQKALQEANLKIRALDTMIDIAEDQLKIDIRKKSGAKPLSK
jgi:transposase